MAWNGIRRTLMTTVAILWTASPLVAQRLPPIDANDNRTPAGELRDGVLTLRIEMRKGNWHPESEDGETIPVYAFGESGKRLQIPGPTIRVPQGTTIDISLHSDLEVPATLHGLHQRPGDDADVITVQPGATERIRFLAGTPGTYLYWARTPDGRRDNNRVLDALLGGALVIDRPGTISQDRIFVLERWNGPTRTAINGKSWPYTERLNYEIGETVHWRVINASDLSHPMHLHGFHFELDAVGDGERYQLFEPGAQPEEFTHSAEIAETFEMSWVPSEPGRWLYHCHRIPHMRLPVPLDPEDVLVADDHEHVHDDDSGYFGMGGMIMGITITGPSLLDTSTGWEPERRLELSVGERNGDPRFFQLSLRDLAPEASDAEPQMSTGLTGPVIVLKQNVPSEITVVNNLPDAPTSIHWHGMELESYYDGVPGWGGLGNRRTPPVDSGQSFAARMTPPRAGTFLYHTHWHDVAQLTGGVHGPLIVLPPGESYEPATDKSFLFSQGPDEPFGAALILMNGTPEPAALELKTGTTYRFRFANITPAVNNLQVSLRNAGSRVEWRTVAKDAADVFDPMLQQADQMIAIGETYDFAYRATSPEELMLEGLSPNNGRRVVQTLIFSDPEE